MSTYLQKLRDPRWQRRRLEIMQRAEFSCEHCGDETKTLNVHHKRYLKGRDPWDYPDNLLAVVCEDCHAVEHAIRSEIESCIAEMASDDIYTLLGVAKGLIAMRLAVYGEQTDRQFTFSDTGEAVGFARQLIGVPRDDIHRFVGKIAHGDGISVAEVYGIYEEAERAATKDCGGGDGLPAN